MRKPGTLLKNTIKKNALTVGRIDPGWKESGPLGVKGFGLILGLMAPDRFYHLGAAAQKAF